MKTLICLLLGGLLISGAMAQSSRINERGQHGKRHMVGQKEALEEFRKRQADNLEIETEELTKSFFMKNYKGRFGAFFAKDAEGNIIRTSEINERGRKVSLIQRGAKLKRATAEEVWESLAEGDSIRMIVPQKAPCEFCDGEEKVIYFPAEAKAFKEYERKYCHHCYCFDEKINCGTCGQERDAHCSTCEDKRDETRWNEDSRALADAYGYDQVEEALAEYLDGHYGCTICWTEFHEKGVGTYSRFCPMCKATGMVPVRKLKEFVIYFKE